MHAVGARPPSLAKAVVVVDEHVDVHDYEDVFFRVCANVDPKRDVVLADGRSTSSTTRRCSRRSAARSASTRRRRARRGRARVAARDRDERRGEAARRRAVGRARAVRALRRRNRAEWPRRAAAGRAGGFGVDTLQGGRVESRAEARSRRVSDEQHDTPHPAAEPLADRLRDRRRLHPRRARRQRPALIVGAIIALVFGSPWIRDLFAAHPVEAASLAPPRREPRSSARHRGRPRHLGRPRHVPLARDDRRRRADRRRRHARCSASAVLPSFTGEGVETYTSTWGRSRTSPRAST